MMKSISNSEDSSAALMENDDKFITNRNESHKETCYDSTIFKEGQLVTFLLDHSQIMNDRSDDHVVRFESESNRAFFGHLIQSQHFSDNHTDINDHLPLKDTDDDIFVKSIIDNLTSQSEQNQLVTGQKKHIVLKYVGKRHLIDDSANKNNENVSEIRHLSGEPRHSFLFSVARVENVIEKTFFEPTSSNTRHFYRRHSEGPSRIQINKLMDTIKEKDMHIVHLNQQHDQIRVAQLCVLQQVNKIVSQIIKLKQQYGIKEDDIEQIKKELDFIPQCLDNAKIGVQIVKPVISSIVDPYYCSILENMDTSMQMKLQPIEQDVTDKTIENENQILKNQSQQHIHQFETEKKHKLLNNLNANEQRIEDTFRIKSEIDKNDKINQSNKEAQLKLVYSLRTDAIKAPCTGAEALTSVSALEILNQWLETQSAERRVAWALNELPGTCVVSSSFGVQAAVSLHLLTTQKPDIPVLLVDTGYLFPETYNFIDQLHERLQLNLHVLRSDISAAWFEARHGRLWEQGVDGIDLYNFLMKVKPMQLALDKLDVKTWFAGLRRNQSESRQRIRIIERQNDCWKVHPIADWTDHDIGMYLSRHNLPYHPLWEKGYVSIGDVHTTRPWDAGLRQEDTRFFGLNRECGLHRPTCA